MFVLDALSAFFTVDVERGQNLYQRTNAFSTNGFEIYGVKKLHEWLRRRIYISPARAWGAAGLLAVPSEMRAANRKELE